MIALALILQIAAPAPAGPTANVSPVVVTASVPKDIPSLLHRFGRPPVGVDGLARWQMALCPAVVGPPPAQAAYLVSRLHETAKTIGIPVAGSSCTPNLIVVFTPDIDKVTDALAKRGSEGFGPLAGLTSQYSAERSAFIRRDVRPYHEFVTTTEVLAGQGSRDSAPLQVGDLPNSSASTLGASKAFEDVSGPSVIGHANDSHVAPDVETSFARLVLVIDQNRMKGLSLQQVSAYMVMLSFAQLDDEADRDVKTILQVADPDIATKDKPQDLTFWDRAYLGALYHASAQNSLGLQESEMDAEIAHEAHDQTLLPKDVGLGKGSASAP